MVLTGAPDHGLHGFKRYFALAVLARNVQQLRVKLRERQLDLLQKEQKLKKLRNSLLKCKLPE